MRKRRGRRPFKSLYTPRNPHKYLGRLDRIVARSNLERAIFKFLDVNENVLQWASEEIVVPYVCATDGEDHRYFVDLFVHLRNGEKLLVEIKPESQTRPPTMSKNGNMALFEGAMRTWSKNLSKWNAAEEFAKKRGWRFVVWTENHLRQMGIRLV